MKINKKELINIIDRPWSYNDINYWKNPVDNRENAIIIFNNQKTRLRAGILIVKDDEILLGEEKGQEGEFSIPGGGINKDETPIDAAVREAQEEVNINAKNARDTGYDYCDCDSKVSKWVKENVPEKNWWYNYYTCLVIADYDSEYKGKVAKADKDPHMNNSSKWYKIKNVINAPTFKEQWKKALIDFGYYKENLNEGYTSNIPHKGATYINKNGKYIWAKGVDHPGLIDLLNLDMDEEEIIDKRGWIRCDSGLSYSGDAPASFIELPEKSITSSQYEALKNWMENCCTGDVFQVSVTSGEFQDYDMDYNSPSYILNRIKYFYTNRILKEDSEKENKVNLNDIIKDVIKEFGIIQDPLQFDASYILPSGRILDTKGKYNNHQHENIADYITKKYHIQDLNANNGSKLFDKLNAIRVTSWIPAFYLPVKPLTKYQEDVLFEMLLHLSTKVRASKPLMISTLNGSQFIEYSKIENPEDILKSIKDYYTTRILSESKNLNEDNQEDYKQKFIERTTKHIKLVNDYAKKLNKSFPDHDKDKLDKLLDDYYLCYLKYNNIPLTDEEEKRLDKATLEHITTNTHHPEYWTHDNLDYFSRNNPPKILEADDMDKEALIEMCCDWCAVSQEMKNTPLEWFKKVVPERWNFNSKQKNFILSILNQIWENNDKDSKYLTEATRTTLVNKSTNADEYKNQKYGKNRFERKQYSKIITQVNQYNNIDMNELFKEDILTVKIPVMGETDQYIVSLKMSGVISEISKNIKSNKNKLEYRTIIQAITKIFNTANIQVSCTCPDYKFTYKHNLIINNDAIEDTSKDPGPGKTGKTAKATGKGCKHILLCLTNLDWINRVASVIQNYINYAETNMKDPFLKVIFPKLYGIAAEDMVEKNLVGDKKYITNPTGVIKAINSYTPAQKPKVGAAEESK